MWDELMFCQLRKVGGMYLIQFKNLDCSNRMKELFGVEQDCFFLVGKAFGVVIANECVESCLFKA